MGAGGHPLRRLATFDRVLLATLLPVFAVVLALHLREAHRTGLAQPPVFAVPGPDGVPVVGGLRLERGADWSGLEPGDRLLRLGERDLRGVGYLGFEAIALEEAGRAGVAPLVYARDGVRRKMDLVMRRHDMPYYRVPFLIGFVGVALLVLLRAPGRTQSRLFFAAFLSLAILETPFMGGPFLQTSAHYAVFHAAGPLAVGLLLAWMTRFPEQMPERHRLSPWLGLVGLLFLVVRVPYFLGGPTPPHWTPSIVLLCDAFFLLAGLGILVWNWVHADPLGRRRLKWFALGAVLGVGPLLLVMLAQPLGLPPDRFRQLFQIAVLFVVLVPTGILVGILRSGLFDIDRLLTSTAAYSLALATVAGAAFAIAPDLVASLAEATNLPARLVAPLVAVAGVAGVVPLGRRLRPHVDRVFFPERVARERGIQRLLRDLSDCREPGELLALLGERLEALLHLEACRVLVAQGDALALPGAEGDGTRLPWRGPLARALERDPVPFEVDERALARVTPEPTAEERRLLASLGARVLLPVRRGKDLAAVVVLGPKRSGDLFPPTELTLLDALAEKASAELLRLRDAEALESERTRAEMLRRLHQETEAASRARSRFLAAASHDLRQPLHALGLFAERLAARPRDAESAALVEQIRASVGSLAAQFDALLDLSRLDTGTVVPEPRELALRPELARLAAEFEEAARAKGLALRFESEEATVRSDPVLLVRIVQNLLANAVRYTERGEVALRARIDGGECAIEVTDTGPGILPERQREIFGEFVQLEGRRGEGLGLGLSIVERTAALLGHRIELESTPGRGSTFRVRVPCAPQRAAPIALPRPAHATPFAERVVVLVEDDLRVLEATRGLLESWGCRVLLADSTAAALEALERSGCAPEAIVADYGLGADDTGLEAIRAIRAFAGADVPAVVVSGESGIGGMPALRASGVPLLPKPVAPAKLRALLAELLRGSAGMARH